VRPESRRQSTSTGWELSLRLQGRPADAGRHRVDRRSGHAASPGRSRRAARSAGHGGV